MSAKQTKQTKQTKQPERRRKTIKDFESEHGGTRIAQLESALESQAQRRNPVHLEIPSASNTLVFGVIGDTHYGSLYEAKDECAALYERFAAEGITDVLHAGDLIDGHKVYGGQEFELHSHGWAKQRDWFAANAPRAKGITTHFITGNHDASMKRAAGIDVGTEIEDRRPDWHFLAEDYGNIVFKTANGRTFRVAMIHPDGGSSYALSYKPQRIVEQLEGGKKPNLLLIGHFHKAEFMPNYRNVAVVQVGTFQWQTPYMVRKGLAAHVGGWIIRVTVDAPGAMSNSVRAEFIASYGRGA